MEPPNSKKRKVEEDVEIVPTSSASSSTASTEDVIEMLDISMTPKSSVEKPENVPVNVLEQSENQNRMDIRLQQLLLSSPAHLFSIGTSSTQQNVSTSWEQWLCFLAANLSPSQWQGYWLAHCAVFGEQAVPVHLLSFFSSQESSSSPSDRGAMSPIAPHPNDSIQANYESQKSKIRYRIQKKQS